MTLPELLISVSLTGLLVTSLAMTSSVILRTHDNTEGRTNNARSEQNVGVWMPTDLASAETVDTEAVAAPCGATAAHPTFAACPAGVDLGGSNTLLLVWHGSTTDSSNNAVGTTTVVSYRYELIGDEYVLNRVLCTWLDGGAATCQSNIVLHDLDGPPPGITFDPGHTSPTWVIKVTSALAATDTSAADAAITDPGLTTKNARRVLVTINGGGDLAGAGGGVNTFSFSAGGTDRETSLSTNDISGAPTFTAARTRCGGNYGLVVDKSSSIGSDFPNVRAGIVNFINTFAGKPVKLQITAFSQVASTVGATAPDLWTRYFDMLDPNDVATLTTAVNALSISSWTNWEEGWFRMLRNSDGTVRSVLPDKVIFFTDGLPNTSRLEAHTGTATPVDDPADEGLSGANGGSFYQKAWNRTSRIINETGVTDVIGVFVGPDSNLTSQWETAGAGYVNQYERGNKVEYQQGFTSVTQRGNNVIWERGYHGDYQRGNNVVWERGYHGDYQRGNNVVWERGYHMLYERNSSVVYERSTTGLTFKHNSTSQSVSNYLASNTTPDGSDNWTFTATPASLGPSWTSLTQTQYEATNTTTDSNDGWRTRVNGSLSGTWTTVTAAQYNGSNTTLSDSTDGWRATKVYTSPFDTWEATTQATYGTAGNNSVAAETDGWRTRQTATSTSWTSVTAAEYNASNLTTSDGTDGWQNAKVYSSPYNTWESTTQATYGTAGNNSVAAETDGWRTRQTATSTSWTSVTAAEYNASNLTTSDGTDGWQIGKAYTSPYDTWEATTQAIYGTAGNNSVAAATDGWRTRETSPSTTWVNVSTTEYNASNTTPSDSTDGWQSTLQAGGTSVWQATTQLAYEAPGANTTSASTDGWRTQVVGGPNTSWTAVSLAQYNGSNTTTDSSDGWRITKIYPANGPYDGHENSSSVSKTNKQILADLVAPGGATYAVYNTTTQSYGDVREVNMFAETNWARFSDAIRDVALGECGGTVTIQTKTAAGVPVSDPFTYSNQLLQTVETSAAYKSGTFDVVLPGALPSTITISPQNQSTLTAWHHVSWVCKEKGVALTAPTMQTLTPDANGWRGIKLNVSANTAISCIQTVAPA
jgi:hypothetical protein